MCDPYIVQKNDWVFKIFRKKGEIAYRDFPEFLNIFKRVNPHIHNIDRICPSQHIFIPLKKLRPGTFPGQSTGIVTIPFVTISNLPEMIKKYSTKHEVKKGDTVSSIISSRYGRYGTKSYNEGIKLFELINPGIADLNRIYAGQMLLIPDPSLQNQSWYQSLFDVSGFDVSGIDVSGDVKGEVNPNSSIRPDVSPSESFVHGTKKDDPESLFEKTASILDAKLLNKGVYYFPRHGEEDFAFDLSRFPVIKLNDGTRLIFSKEEKILDADLEIIKSYWRNAKVVPISSEASVAEVLDSAFASIENDLSENRLSFSDKGVGVKVGAKWIKNKSDGTGKTGHNVCITLIKDRGEQTAGSIIRYLQKHNIIIKDVLQDSKCEKKNSEKTQNKHSFEEVVSICSLDRKAFVNDLLTAMGYNYAQNVSITFPYAGIQVEAVSNLISRSDGTPLLVDFGDIYGDAVSAIEKTGFDIIQIKKEDDLQSIIQKLLSILGVNYTNNPTFFAAKRPAIYNTALTISGFLVANTREPKILLAVAPLHKEIIQFLQEKGIKIIKIESSTEYKS